MAHDFAKQRAARANRSSKPAQAPWLWLVSGIVIGTLVSFLVYLATLTPPPRQEALSASVPQEKKESPPESKKHPKKPAPGSETRPQFDFYDILRHTEGRGGTAGKAPAGDGAPATAKAPGKTPVEVPVEVPEPPKAKQAVASAPATTVAAPVSPPPGAKPPAPVTPATRPPEAPKPAALALQAGAFSQHAEADRRRGEILLLGYDARIETVKTPDGQTRYRVSVGPFADPQAQANARRALRDIGIETF